MSMIRVLQVVGGMNRGGVETWLMHVLRQTDRSRFRIDFLCHTTQPCAYDEEARALGAKIIPCVGVQRPWVYARNFRRALREHGPYDVVHSHVHDYSGYVLQLAHRAGAPGRIAHSHLDTSRVDAKGGLARKCYLRLMRWWLARHATLGLAASRPAAVALFGRNWEADRRWRLFYYGIDLAPFGAPVDKEALRAELGLPTPALVVGHVGRFDPQKNHAFLVEVAAEVKKLRPDMRLLLVGDGPLRPAIEEKVRSRGLADCSVFLGARSDVPRLMRGAMDVLLFPSHYEGLPVTGIEAQAAGLPVVLSDVITEEVDAVKPLITRLSLREPAGTWARAVLSAGGATAAASSQGLAVIEEGPFNILRSVHRLLEIYAGEAKAGMEARRPSSSPREPGNRRPDS
jgi:glycosyltransferase involved in cell wall biosynthesis